jgi:hypothetical protein
MNQRFYSVLLVTLSVAITAHATEQRPESLSTLPVAAQASISAVLGQDIPGYRMEVSAVGISAWNPRQRLGMQFSPSGVNVLHGGTGFRMALLAYGHGTSLVSVSAASPQVYGNRVEYHHGSLEEWYVNGPIGLEQGFTINRAPGTAVQDQPLTLVLTLSGDFVALRNNGKQSLTLTAKANQSKLIYSGLSAHDATNKELPAWIELDGKQLLLRVDDSDASYPVVVDPLIQLAELTSSDGVSGDEFGFSVAISGKTIVVGASQYNSSKVGAAYVFVEGPSGWANMTQTAKLTASDGAAGALFGSSVAFADSNTVVVGAPHATVHGNQLQGEAYVFVKPGNGWVDMTETARLASSDGKANDYFGYSVSGLGNTIAVGASQASPQVQFQGAVYVFVKRGSWKTTSHFTAKLTTSNAQGGDSMGVSVSLSRGSLSQRVLVAGAPGVNSQRGAAYVFVEPLGGWQTTSNFDAELTASDGQPDDLLGNSASISGNTVVAGAYLAKIGGNLFQGAAYVFVEPPSGWASMNETAKLTASDGHFGDEFGYSVSVSGKTAIIGASNDPSTNAAYVFRRPETGWVTTSHFNSKLTASDASIFGFSVASSGDTVVAGAIGNQALRGAAYVFGLSSLLPRDHLLPWGGIDVRK